MDIKKYKEGLPYRFFFPFSLIGAVSAVSLWILAYAAERGWISPLKNPYPVQHHILLISSLFLLPALKGFLFTAIPRFTGTDFLGFYSIGLLLSLQILISVLALFFENAILFYFLLNLDFLLLLGFVVIRFSKAKGKLSEYLYFIPAGLFLGTVGSVFLSISRIREDISLFHYGKELIVYGMIPCAVFGAGIRIVNMILNRENPEKRSVWMQKAESIQNGRIFSLIFVFFSLSESAVFYLFSLEYSVFFRTLRFLICIFLFIRYFQIFDLSMYKGRLSFLILISLYSFLLGLAGHAWGGAYSVHMVHLYLISGLSLFIAGIMTRVVFSHEGLNLDLEKNSSVFLWVAVLFLLAALTRASAVFMPSLMISHFAYASFLFIL
ncbi:MAG TPA: NnrS family protein, partial [Leptospiraceae bacterium]|nr:NnrS family protein [Leptospiraceae bacterium]